MEKGYINLIKRRVFWDTKPHKGFFGSAGGIEVIPSVPTWGINNIEAYHCAKCKLILFTYGKENPILSTFRK
jgi:hypothetical protein